MNGIKIIYCEYVPNGKMYMMFPRHVVLDGNVVSFDTDCLLTDRTMETIGPCKVCPRRKEST